MASLQQDVASRITKYELSEGYSDSGDESDTMDLDESFNISFSPTRCLAKCLEKKSGTITKNTTSMDKNLSCSSFVKFRLQYLIVFASIMLADGLQGTHLYVLYEGYGYSVPSLYALGYASGAVTSLFMGAIVDRIGRKKAVIIYCILEIIINYMEQFPILLCLIASRVIGGITQNLLFTVFETWLVTEHHRREFEDDKLEIIIRDSNIVSNMAAIISGYIAHCLASLLGPVGPFVGAVGFTFLSLLIVGLLWCENYGNNVSGKQSSMQGHVKSASNAILNNPNILSIGLIHGLTDGSLQTFVFLWSPMLQSISSTSSSTVPGLDAYGEPAYGLIFGAYMLFGVTGGYIEPKLIKILSKIQSSLSFPNHILETDPLKHEDNELDMKSRYILSVVCYLCSSVLFLVPYFINNQNPYAFIVVLVSFLMFEFLVGIYLSSQSMIRCTHIPNDSKCSIMTMLRFITNIAVASGVLLSNNIPEASCFGVLALMMMMAAMLQFSFIQRTGKSSSFNEDYKEKKE